MGLCGAREGRCVALEPTDCRASEGCRELGLCTPVGGRCVSRLEDCLAVEACFENDVDCRLEGTGEWGECRWPFEYFTF
jgi:hypothetical protein